MVEQLAQWTLFDSTTTLVVTALAVLLAGLSKGGMGGAFALMGVPVLALVMPPVQAAALLLPILLMMDAISLWAWRGWFDRTTLRMMLPGAAIGIAAATLVAASTSDTLVRLIVGLVALGFVARLVLSRANAQARPHSAARGTFWGAATGFTSFVAHAGGPTFQVYALPLRLDPKLYTGTSVLFFAIINMIKVVPYAALGQFSGPVLASALVMLPLAALATLAGAAIVRRLRADVFYPFMYVMIAIVGAKLVWDGVRALLAG
jgi:uncharacterized membrane protein YfcA